MKMEEPEGIDIENHSDPMEESSDSEFTDTSDSSDQDEEMPNSTIIYPPSSDESVELNTSDEEDEVVKIIIRSQDVQRTHPPTINLDDIMADICFHPVNDIIALGSITGDVLLYKYSNEENELISTIELHEKACRDIQFNEDGSILYSAGKDKSIVLTDIGTEKMTRLFDEAHNCPIYTMTVIDKNTFVTADDEGTVKMWDLRQKNSIFSLKETEDFINQMITNEDKKYLVCACADGTLTTLNLRAKKLHVQTEDYPHELTSLGLFKNSQKILVAGNKGNLYLFNWNEFGLHTDEIPSLTKKAINCLIPITENIVITGGEDKMLRAISLFPNRYLGIAGQHDLSVECIDICNDGTVIGSYSYDNTVRFWNISYFEDMNISKPLKGGKQKQMKYNLPSSKNCNASDFFSDLQT